MKVNFVICGTQKAGTTALDQYLRLHPDICMGIVKEVHFFDNEDNFQSENVDYSIYHSAFDVKPSHKLVGESSPIYMYWHDAPGRIWQYNPEMKLIVILRNPIERAFSHWNMERLRKSDDLTFWEAIQHERQRSRHALPYQHKIFSYIDRGHYVIQLRKLWSYFSKERVLILKSEELRFWPDATLKKVYRFLGVKPCAAIEATDVHSLPYSHSMSDREYAFLHSIFCHEIRELELLLGWDCSDWLSERK